MNLFTISQYFLFNSNEGYIKIVEFNNTQNVILLWGLSKEFSICENCSEHKWFSKCPKIEDSCLEIKRTIKTTDNPEYINTGDFKLAEGYFKSINQFSEQLTEIYPNHRIIPIGTFRNITECRKYLSEMKDTLNGKAI